MNATEPRSSAPTSAVSDAAPAGRRHPIRRLSFRGALVVTGPIALAVVLGGISVRWDGTRTESDALVPLRPLAVDEAALLLTRPSPQGAPSAIVVDVDGGEAVVRTGYYVVRSPLSPEYSCKTPAKDGTCLTWVETSGRGFLSEHVVDAEALRRELGTDLTVRPRDDLPGWVTYWSRYLPVFVAIEAAILAVLAASLLAAVARSSPWSWLPLTTAHLLVFLVVVPIYAPAFVDYDLFFQRIVVEYLWLLAVLLVGPLAAVSTPLLLIHLARLPTDVRRRRRLRSLGRAGLFVGMLGLILETGTLVIEFFYAQSSTPIELARVVEKLDPATQLRLIDGARTTPRGQSLLLGTVDPALRAEIRRVLTLETEGRDRLQIFLAVGGSDYLVLSQMLTYSYAEVRESWYIHDFGFASHVMRVGAQRPSFLEFVRHGYLAGAPVLSGARSVGVVLLIPNARGSRHALVRWILASFGHDCELET